MSRSLLFVPGDSPRKFEKAAAGDADGLILDLEDSVAPDTKAAARGMVRAMLAQGAAGKQLWVRINALDTGLSVDDLAAVVPGKPFGILLPKCRNGDDLRQVSHYLDALEAAAAIPPGTIKILPIATELGSAMFGLGTYANVTPRLWGITWGAEDLSADLGVMTKMVDGVYTDAFRIARSMCLYAAADAGVPAFDTVCVDIDNIDVAIRESTEARRDGFTGKLSIHPKHVPVINAAFTPGADEISWAKKIVAAFAANPNTGAFKLEGKMIDRPHLRAARRILGITS
ncbi:MAG: CoA ester lyase [Betaproteobacteria bacterium]|nr:CoA ester lyase [Betaproteobacteria bacterium]